MLFRSVPYVVEAVQSVPGNEQEMVEFLNRHNLKWWAINNYGLCIERPDRVHTAYRGDWVAFSEVMGVEILGATYFHTRYEMIQHGHTYQTPEHPTLF